MNKNFTKTSALVAVTLSGMMASAQSFVWTNRITLSNEFSIYAPVLGADKNGNCYMAGSYNSSAASGNAAIVGTASNFNMAYNHFTPKSLSSWSDLLITKFNVSGVPQWANRGQVIGIGGSGNNNNVDGLFVDSVGNSYMIASPMDSIQFGTTVVPDKEVYSNGNGVIVKYNSAGSLIWAKALTTAGDSYGSAIAVDDSANSYVAGWYFNSTSGSTFGTTTLNSFGTNYASFFVGKYDVNGNNKWAAMVDTANWDYAPNVPAAVGTDALGNLYMSAAYGPGYGSNNRFWITQYSHNGVQNWKTDVRSSGGTINVNSMVTDKAGNSFICGTFTGTFKFGTTTLTNNSNSGIFLLEVNSAGNFVWADQILATGYSEYAYSLSKDANDNLYMVGSYTGTLNFGGSSITSVSGSSNVFLAKFNSAGVNAWAISSTGTATTQIGSCVAYGTNNMVYLGGYFNGGSNETIDLGKATPVVDNSSTFEGCYFVGAYNTLSTGISEIKANDKSLIIYPNPSSDRVSVVMGAAFEKEGTLVSVYDMTGRLVTSMTTNQGQSAQVNFNTDILPNGIYFIQASNGVNSLTRKLVVNHN